MADDYAKRLDKLDHDLAELVAVRGAARAKVSALMGHICGLNASIAVLLDTRCELIRARHADTLRAAADALARAAEDSTTTTDNPA